MIVILDNYDSFVHNLSRYVRVLGYETIVLRSDKLSIKDLEHLQKKMTGLIISPGPGTPEDAGISIAAIRLLAPLNIPILGVCLGHQAIATAFGGTVSRALRPMHGKSSQITHTEEGIFSRLPPSFKVGRYHSLIVQSPLPAELKATAFCEEGEIMALQHQKWPVFGVQFHPESVLTEYGSALLQQFLWNAMKFKEMIRGEGYRTSTSLQTSTSTPCRS